MKAAKAEGLSQIDVSGLAGPKDEALVLGYRYLRPPYALGLAIDGASEMIVAGRLMGEREAGPTVRSMGWPT